MIHTILVAMMMNVNTTEHFNFAKSNSLSVTCTYPCY